MCSAAAIAWVGDAVGPDVILINLYRLLIIVYHAFPIGILSRLELCIVPLIEAVLEFGEVDWIVFIFFPVGGGIIEHKLRIGVIGYGVGFTDTERVTQSIPYFD